jgi:hypothetical protein
MTTSQTEIESQVTELSAMAFEAFCADVSVMFGLEAKCKQRQAAAETVEDLNEYFEELAAVVSVEAKGTLDGTFQLVLDRAGLFTLAGITFPLTQEQILKKTKDGSTEDAEALSNALADAAKVLIEAWDKLFREKLPGHDQFVKTTTFIGNPWEKPQEDIGLAADENLLSVLCEMTAGPYPTFNCAAIFPKKIFAGPTEQQTEPQQKTDSEAEDKAEQTAQNESEDKAEEITEADSDQKAEPQAQEKSATSPEEKTEPTARPSPRPKDKPEPNHKPKKKLSLKTKKKPNHRPRIKPKKIPRLKLKKKPKRRPKTSPSLKPKSKPNQPPWNKAMRLIWIPLTSLLKKRPPQTKVKSSPFPRPFEK